MSQKVWVQGGIPINNNDGSGGGGSGQPTDITSTTLDIGGANYSRTINIPTSVLNLINTIVKTGDGNSYLSNDGTYKTFSPSGFAPSDLLDVSDFNESIQPFLYNSHLKFKNVDIANLYTFNLTNAQQVFKIATLNFPSSIPLNNFTIKSNIVVSQASYQTYPTGAPAPIGIDIVNLTYQLNSYLQWYLKTNDNPNNFLVATGVNYAFPICNPNNSMSTELANLVADFITKFNVCLVKGSTSNASTIPIGVLVPPTYTYTLTNGSVITIDRLTLNISFEFQEILRSQGVTIDYQSTGVPATMTTGADEWSKQRVILSTGGDVPPTPQNLDDIPVATQGGYYNKLVDYLTNSKNLIDEERVNQITDGFVTKSFVEDDTPISGNLFLRGKYNSGNMPNGKGACVFMGSSITEFTKMYWTNEVGGFIYFKDYLNSQEVSGVLKNVNGQVDHITFNKQDWDSKTSELHISSHSGLNNLNFLKSNVSIDVQLNGQTPIPLYNGAWIDINDQFGNILFQTFSGDICTIFFRGIFLSAPVPDNWSNLYNNAAATWTGSSMEVMKEEGSTANSKLENIGALTFDYQSGANNSHYLNPINNEVTYTLSSSDYQIDTSRPEYFITGRSVGIDEILQDLDITSPHKWAFDIEIPFKNGLFGYRKSGHITNPSKTTANGTDLDNLYGTQLRIISKGGWVDWYSADMGSTAQALGGAEPSSQFPTYNRSSNIFYTKPPTTPGNTRLIVGYYDPCDYIDYDVWIIYQKIT